MAGQKIGMKVTEEYRFDGQAVCFGIIEILVDVSLRIDDGRATAVCVTDQIGRMYEAPQVILIQYHGVSPLVLPPPTRDPCRSADARPPPILTYS